jgi:predicted acylesterase/phospholipase RssA
MNSKKVPVLLHPFQKIGLCFSGGGYRAASFSLGVLTYLNRVPFGNKSLLDHVTALSTVSGGSLTGVCYAVAVAQNQPFEDFYNHIYRFLDEDQLLKRAKIIMLDNSRWINSSRRRTLINAFAMAYEELLVRQDFGVLTKLSESKSLKYVCFNATEFSYGLTFRFQNIGKFANHFLSNKRLEAMKEQVRLADIIASSSCFPVGFEPLLFPDDYFEDHNLPEYQNLKELPDYKEGIGIMDGGIVDNQGIGSIVKIDQCQKPDLPLDLIMINDVGSFSMPPWRTTTQNPEKSLTGSLKNYLNKLTSYFKLKPVYLILFVLGIIMIVLSLTVDNFTSPLFLGAGGFLAGAGTVLTLLGIIGTLWSTTLQQKVNRLLYSKIPQVIWEDLNSLTKLEVAVVQRMLAERISSSYTMINYIFVRQLRRLNFELLYSKDRYKNRRISSTIYQLSGKKTTLETEGERDHNQENQNKISEKIQKASSIASEMPTTLWWNPEDRIINRLDNLVACGQFTTCFNLIGYIEHLPSDLRNEETDRMLLFLKADWEHFKNNPLGLVPKSK